MIEVKETHVGSAWNPLTEKPNEIYRYTMTNDNQLTITILSYGATVESIKYPDKHGKMEDICLGYDTLEEYEKNKNLHMGSVIGRMANCISNGYFNINEEGFEVTKNYKNLHHFNGGFNGLHSMNWQAIETRPNGFVMQHISPDGYEGFPGELIINITFTLDNDNNFGVCIEAVSNKMTPVNISQTIYLNLAGHKARKEGLAQHNIKLMSDRIIECDREKIPTGSFMPVCYSPYDLRKYVNLGRRLTKFFTHSIKGFDHNYCIDLCPGQMKAVAKIIHPCTGRWLEVFTDQPTVNFSTCNDWPDIEQTGATPISGKEKAVYAQHGAFCFSTQGYPDALSNSHFPCVIMQPKRKYCHKVVYRFGNCI